MEIHTSFRLRTLFLYMSCFAISCEILSKPNVWTWSLVTTIKSFLLMCAFPLALSVHGKSRAFWLAFGAVGWFFNLLVNGIFGARFSSESFLFWQLLTRWPGTRQGEERFYFHELSNQFSVLAIATLAGYFCCWIVKRDNAKQK